MENGDEEYDELINAAAEVVVETGQHRCPCSAAAEAGLCRAADWWTSWRKRASWVPSRAPRPAAAHYQGAVAGDEVPPGVPGGTPPESASGAAPGGAEEDMPPFDVGEALDRAEEDTL